MLAKLLIFAAVVYGVVIAGLYFGQKKLVYIPDTRRVDPKSLLSSIDEVQLKRPDGATLLAWYLEARQGKPTLLYFHGNGGNVSYRANRFAMAAEAGVGLLMLSYRGYGGSEGEPSAADNIADGMAAHDWLTKRGVATADIVVFGESLGTGIAVPVAAERPSRGVVLQTPFSSLVDVAASHYPWAPVRFALTERYPSIKRIASIKAPLLIVHGTNDRTVPHRFGRKLYEAAIEPKTFVTIDGAGHNDLDSYGAFKRALDWISALP